MARQLLSLCSGAALVVGLVGCGRPGGRDTLPASGTVLYNGAPVTEVRVIFTPAAGRPAFGHTDAQGRFILTTFEPDDGAVPGKHKVTISDRRQGAAPPVVTGAAPPSRFPKRYQSAAATPWEVEVTAGQSDFKLEMTDDPADSPRSR